MKLYQHQANILDSNPPKKLLAWSCGIGKTLALAKLAEKNGGKWLIIATKLLVDQWEDKLKEYNINLDCQIIHKELFKKLAPTLPRMNVIIDESHYFSGMHGFRKKSAMLKMMLAYIKRHNPEFIYLGTATPYLSTPWNIFAQANILGHNWNYMKFKNMFFQDVPMGQRFPVPILRKYVTTNSGEVIPVSVAIERLVRAIGDVVRMEDCFDIPEQLFKDEYLKLTKEQVTAIENLDDIAAIARWSKAHQICGGTLKSDGYTEDKFYSSEKVDRIMELTEQYKKMIIVCKYNNEIEYLSKKIKAKNIVVINGATKNKYDLIKKTDAKDESIILVNSACSEGWEAPRTPIMVFYSIPFSLKDYSQIAKRILRANHLKKNVYISLIIKNSIDNDVKTSMDKKEDFKIESYDNTK